MSDKLILRNLLLGFVMLFISFQVNALGLGNIKVSSALNTPFRAEIPVTSFRAADKEGFEVKLASGSEFTRAGLERTGALSQLKFKVIYRGGKPVIQVSSHQAMKEPFLSFLVSATSNNSKLLREYTVLLDPPSSIYTPEPVVKPATKTTSVRTVPAAVQKPIKPAIKPAAKPVAAPTAKPAATKSAPSLAGARSYGPVKRGDTLWKIAAKVRPDNAVSQQQMMMAIAKSNPDAFVRGNINGLKTGHELQIPARTEIVALSKSAAAAAAKADHAAWKKSNETKAVAAKQEEKQKPAEQEVAIEEVDPQQVTASTDSKPNTAGEQATPASAENASETEARLALTAPSEDDLKSEQELVAAGNDQLTKVQEQLTLAQEAVEAKEQERLDLEARVTTMQTKIDTLERIVSLDDSNLAQLQSQIEDKDEAVFPPVLPIEETQAGQYDSPDEAGETAISDQSDVALELGGHEDGLMTEPGMEEERENGLLAEPGMEEESEDDLLTEPAIADTSDDENQSWFGKIITGVASLWPYVLAGLAALLVWLLLRLRNNNKPDDSEDSWQAMATVDPSEDNLAVTNSPVNIQGVNTGAVGVTDVDHAESSIEESAMSVPDLMIEADTYINYANYEKAKEALEQAQSLEPENEDIAGKLLFVLYQQQDENGFVTVAEKMSDKLQQNDPEQWEKIVGWGEKLSPAHTLFGSLAAASSASLITEDNAGLELQDIAVDDALGDDGIVVEVVEPYKADLEEALEDENVTDTPVDLPSSFEVPTLEEVALDGSIEVAAEEVKPAEIIEEADLALELPEIADSPEISTNEAPSVKLSEDEVAPIAAAEEDDFDSIDEANTKLDLASAYIDMGEPEGARAILQEVLQEGNEAQQTRAKSLLDGLA